ncbi:hypothetical protein G5V59_03770 [Nocardioides sp. W3-2-3]|uniref:hypothetical protein n=1 Tax=Nocardioides convexus TaxID=2712224 RepID=UPI0024184792|nr:hypothetical protein [Nocardioides convexus]NGZ99759.1 hypothetical protein [Nocardioides convexus]
MTRRTPALVALVLSALMALTLGSTDLAHAAAPADRPTLARAVPVKPGLYTGRITSGSDRLEPVSVRVTRARYLRDFKVNLGVFCALSGTLQVRAVRFPATKISSTGWVNRTWKPSAGTTITLKVQAHPHRRGPQGRAEVQRRRVRAAHDLVGTP